MKRFILLTITILSINQVVWAIDFYTNKKVFYSDSGRFIVELYTNIPAANYKGELNATYKKVDKGIQSSYRFSHIIKKDSKIFSENTYTLNSPVFNDSIIEDIIDIQRIILPSGNYTIEVTISDVHDTSNQSSTLIPVFIKPIPNGAFISDIEFLESISKTTTKNKLTKSGYDLLPLIVDYFPSDIDKLASYIEIYNSDKVLSDKEDFLIKYAIESIDLKTRLNEYGKFSKIQAKKIIPHIQVIDISNLPSGNYNLIIDIVTSKNELIYSKKEFFQRNNPNGSIKQNNINDIMIDKSFVRNINNYDSLSFYINGLSPIANQKENDEISLLYKDYRPYRQKHNELIRLRKKNKRKVDTIALHEYVTETGVKNLKSAQQYFYKFWMKRSTSNPELLWINYKKELMYVHENYKTNLKYGHETDRGRVYLQYGKPNEIVSRPNDDGSYPYEIWYYKQIDKFPNQKFLFYDSNLMASDYTLLHSTLRSETQNWKWESILKFRKDPSYKNIDSETESRSETNDRARDLWNRAGGY